MDDRTRYSRAPDDLVPIYTPKMIDIAAINDKYRVCREKPGGKIYVIAVNDARIASYSSFTETLEWYQTVSAEDMALIEAYLKHSY